jgi:transcriptional regulator with XRE-family HTH domain
MQAPRHIKEIVASNIASERERLGLSRRAFGQLIDADQMLVYKWERGLHRPSDENMAALAEKTGRDLSWFYTDHEKEQAA